MDFPKTLYVIVAKDKDDEFLIAEETLEAHATVGEVTRVAKYTLADVGSVRGSATFTSKVK